MSFYPKVDCAIKGLIKKFLLRSLLVMCGQANFLFFVIAVKVLPTECCEMHF